ncbi:MAG TPA: hypothetical protein VHZ95_09850, partial [Polyangiales bacterium]|nr:hypothetical protein [Polyangiales bacterium]
PLALFGLGIMVRQRETPTRAGAIGLCLVALALFFSHVVPFALFALGCGLIALDRSIRVVLIRLAPLAPAGFATLLWLARSRAGQATVTAAIGGTSGPRPLYEPAAFALRDLPNWLTDVFQGDDDRTILLYWSIALALTFSIGAVAFALRRRHRVTNLAVRLIPLAPLALLLYFISPSSYDWIWPIAQRFPLLALLFLIPVLPAPPLMAARGLATALLVLTFAQERVVAHAFDQFDRTEVADFDEALAAIPPAKRVVGLIYDRYSRAVKFAPFIHYVAYYQARKGGAVMFTFADFPQSPFRFRENDRPPRVPPRWEWTPQRVRANDLAWYEYVLVRAGAAPCGKDCKPIYRGALWSVWKRD